MKFAVPDFPANPGNSAGPIGKTPIGLPVADASVDVFGTTYDGGAIGQGAVFEIQASGFVAT